MNAKPTCGSCQKFDAGRLWCPIRALPCSPGTEMCGWGRRNARVVPVKSKPRANKPDRAPSDGH